MALERLRYHVADDPSIEARSRSATSFGVGDEVPEVEIGSFTSNEGAARFYLEQLLMDDGRPVMRSAAGPDRPEQAAGLVFDTQQELPQTSTRVVRFFQLHDEIPVFGAEATVELDDQRALVAADVRVGDVPEIDRVPSLDAPEALRKVGAFTEIDVDPAALPPPTLVFFEGDGAWHLAWLVRSVPALPPEARPDEGDRSGHGIGRSFRSRRERADYVVDAHDGEILYYYGTAPTIGIPVKCQGTDEDGTSVEFYGAKGNGGAFVLNDPLRRVRTFDFGQRDIERDAPPVDPVVSGQATFDTRRRAAVTAHRHGALVQDFFKRVLQRDGIDDKGMELISIVNVTCAGDQQPPEWRNACWWNNRMWYGQVRNGRGELVSLARYLDVIAHELTHGVIETTADLVYRNESGALNESFADVFGIIIANSCRASDPDDVRTWDWQLGRGLGQNGAPLRDFADPASQGDPAHMDDYVQTTRDLGGVHINSSIHNKAVHALLTAKDRGGAPVLSVEEAATVLYLALVHLHRLATFADARQKAIDVAKIFYSGDTQRHRQVVATIAAAYDSVGIRG